ncbi:MAG: radical SAM protein [Acidobacteria bacterium]|nr:radical SAM protein [Acidobacteriota bacterium]
MNVVLLSTYELGRQPFGLASPAAWLRRAGASVTCLDLSRQAMDEEAIRAADLVAFYLPMHTATRLAPAIVERLRRLNPRAHLCFYGLYAPMNEAYLRGLGALTILGGEFEQSLVSLYQRLSRGEAPPRQPEPLISLGRLAFIPPDRTGLPPLASYARLQWGDGVSRTVGYTEASRGCKHRCRHCPIVPVYDGVFRIVPREVVLEDIRQQVAAGAEHITFGDPDFFNGIGHALPLVEAFHREFPRLTYDVTIKIEHLLQHSRHLTTLRATGCLFVTSAAESVDDRFLALLDKNHTRDDFIEVVRRCREAGLVLQPTFVPFTPWTTLEGYLDLLSLLAELELVEHVAPIQLAIRLLIPAGSKLLELTEVQELVGPFNPELLTYRWENPDTRVDDLQRDVQAAVAHGEARGASRREIFTHLWRLAQQAAGVEPEPRFESTPLVARAAIPYLNEPWYC